MKMIVLQVLAAEVFLVVLAFGLGWLFGVDPVAGIEGSPKALLQGLLALPPLWILIWWTMRSKWSVLVELKRVVFEDLVPIFEGTRRLEIVVISLAAGIGEEIFFRGFLQIALSQPLGVWVALLIASLVFGLLHWLTPIFVILTAAVGMYLGILLIVTENLAVPIFVHAAHDMVAFTVLLRASATERGARPTKPEPAR